MKQIGFGALVGLSVLVLAGTTQAYFCNNLIVKVLDAETNEPVSGAFISGKMFNPTDGWYNSFGNIANEEGQATAEICGTGCFLKVMAVGYEMELYGLRPGDYMPETIQFRNKDVSVVVHLFRKKDSPGIVGKKE